MLIREQKKEGSSRNLQISPPSKNKFNLPLKPSLENIPPIYTLVDAVTEKAYGEQ